jgi:hypothetical protein
LVSPSTEPATGLAGVVALAGVAEAAGVVGTVELEEDGEPFRVPYTTRPPIAIAIRGTMIFGAVFWGWGMRTTRNRAKNKFPRNNHPSDRPNASSAAKLQDPHEHSRKAREHNPIAARKTEPLHTKTEKHARKTERE